MARITIDGVDQIIAATNRAVLVRLDDAGFRSLFAGSPIKRIGVVRFLRNVLIAVGNSGDAGLIEAVEARLADPEPLVRGAAIWALRRLDSARADRQALAFLTDERDADVRSEWLDELAA